MGYHTAFVLIEWGKVGCECIIDISRKNQPSFFCFHTKPQENHNYPAGVSFSPDGTRMYVSFWGEATWQIWREDGLRFDDETAGVTYEHGIGLDG